jgi:hypothetical protein
MCYGNKFQDPVNLPLETSQRPYVGNLLLSGISRHYVHTKFYKDPYSNGLKVN